jgi:hypothetical protein
MNQILENYLNRDILAQAFPTVLAGFWVTVQVALCVISWASASDLRWPFCG